LKVRNADELLGVSTKTICRSIEGDGICCGGGTMHAIPGREPREKTLARLRTAESKMPAGVVPAHTC